MTPAERKIKPSQRGTLTLAYDPNVVDDAGSTISVFYYSPSREWRRIGGEVDSKKHTVTVPFDEFGYYKVMKLRRSYNDITNHGWARNILNALYAKGFMAPLRFEQFGTDDRTSRGEFATLLVKGLNLPITSDSRRTFTDVAPGTSSFTWDYDSIETAARAGYHYWLDRWCIRTGSSADTRTGCSDDCTGTRTENGC
ncbi:S-layer homology domain-containing protein [Paenibacillus amylolyticus]|nr:S-layer homology domain-containing protein [Paenibacillus amylolyticus]